MTNEQGAARFAKVAPCSGPIQLLDDDPVRYDELGEHDALAEAIARLVDSEAGGKAIALEGAWGSGKSTVIELLKGKLEEKNKGKVFVFDSWAHEGDSLRRAIIEEFWKWIENQTVSPQQEARREQDRLNKEVQKLARRLSEQTVDTTVKLTLPGRMMVLLLALVPPGIALATNSVGWLRWVGLILTTSPFLLLSGVLVCIVVRKCKTSNFDQVLGIFMKQVEGRAETKGWSTPDPTSIEFAETFQKLLGSVLRRLGERGKLVIVLDNLDRVPSREAMAAVATVRALFEQRTSQSNRFWLLVPYDPTCLLGLPNESAATWAGIFPDDLGGSYFLPVKSATIDNESERAFRHKFFQARFFLPQPVLLRWQEYLRNCLTRALPAHNNPSLLDSICTLFALVRDRDFAGSVSRSGDRTQYAFPTPRGIKLFVNRLAAIHLQWACDLAPIGASTNQVTGKDKIEPIPLMLQAGFALCEQRAKRDENPQQSDLSICVPGTRGKRFFDDAELRLIERANHSGTPRIEWERHVAAMWYGVPQEEALHMLLWPQIHDAFSWGVIREGYARDKLPFQTLLNSRAIGGFWEITQAVAREFIGNPDPSTFERCAKTLAALAKWKAEDEGWTQAWGTVEADAITALRAPEATLESNRGSPVDGRNFAVALEIPEASRDLAGVGLEALSRVGIASS